MKENLLTIDEVAGILEISPDKVNQYVKEGGLAAIYLDKELRFHPEAVRAFFEELPQRFDKQKKRILIIDDDPLVGGSLKNLLEKTGYEVAVVSIGLAALDIAAREDFDLVIADIRMPGMNGLETLCSMRELRKQFGKPCLPEIILTAYDEKEVRKEAGQMGIPDFILKPFELDEFLSTVKNNLNQKKRGNRRVNVPQS